VGVGLFGVLTGFLANVFLAPKDEKAEEKAPEQPAEQPTGRPAPDPAPLPASIGLIAQMDQLSAEVGSLRRLLEGLPAAHLIGPDVLEDPPNKSAQDSNQDTPS
jgi:hypothetical protein